MLFNAIIRNGVKNSLFSFIRQSHRISQLICHNSPIGKPVKINGWVRHVRSLKDITFLAVNDGSCLQNLQIVVAQNTYQHYQELPTYGSSVSVTGVVQASAGREQTIDVLAESVKILGQCHQQDFPFKVKKHHPPEYCRQFLHLRPKTAAFGSLLRVRNGLTQAVHSWLQADGYLHVDCPVLTSNACEGGGDVFAVEPANSELLDIVENDDNEGKKKKHFFGVPTYLTVSSQLHLETVAGAFDKVYTLGPTFRAENSRGRHHLSEFSMLEAELSFIESLEDLIKVMETLVQGCLRRTLETSEQDLHWHWTNAARDKVKQEAMYNTIMSEPFTRMTYTEAMEVLRLQKGFNYQPQWGCDLQKEHEYFLIKHCGDVPVFVTDFPAATKPFYMKANTSEKSSAGPTVAGVDLLLPGVAEVCGGSLRETDLDRLQARIQAADINSNLDWYLDLRRYGSVPHGGFGLGFERLLMAMTGVRNIRDVLPFPRFSGSCQL